MHINATGKKYSLRTFLKELFLTLAFCLFVAILLTVMSWGGDFTLNLLISIGYGLSVQISMTLFGLTFSNWPRWLLMTLPLLLGVALGTLHAQYQLMGNLDLDAQQIQYLKQFFTVGLIFSIIACYLLISQDRQALIKDQLRQAQLQRVEQERELTQSQLRVLQSQIEPHFLFNTLASIQVLIESDPKQAGFMLKHLTEFLRSTLARSRTESTTLQQEFQLIQSYLDIQQIRLGARLQYEIETPGKLLRALPFPALLLQPLVENAIKHGIEPKMEGGKLTVNVEESAGKCCVVVRDTGMGLSQGGQGGEGVGLENIRARLTSLYGSAAHLSIREDTPAGVVCRLEIPIEH